MHSTNNLFIVAIDFWAPSRKALEMALRFAAQFDGRILAIHVIQNGAHYPDDILVDEDTLEEDLQRALEHLLEPFRDRGILIESEVVEGKVSRQLTEAMHQHDADALFVGMREGRILEDIFIGAHTLQLVKAAEVPLIVVEHLPHDTKIDRLLIPFDPKFGIEGTLRFLKELGQPLGEHIQLLTAISPGEDDKTALAAASAAVEALNALGIDDVEIVYVADEQIYAAIMDQLRDSVGTYDLVLLEHHDHASRGELTLGSLVEDVVTKGRMPVLCAPRIHKR